MIRDAMSFSAALVLAATAHAGSWMPPKPPQSAPAAAPAAPALTAECQKLKSEYLAMRPSQAPERDDSRTTDGARGGNEGWPRGTTAPDGDLKAARARYEQRCGALTPDMLGATASAQTAPSAQPAPAAPLPKFPKKAGPNMGTGSSPERCAQLHQSMKDALARKDACAKKDNQCRQRSQTGYEQLRSAYHSGCGDIPADAKPGKRR